MELTRLNKSRSPATVVSIILAIAVLHTSALAAGQLLDVVVHSPSLVGNVLGDSPDRDVTIYLPPDYAENPDKRYASVYLLHGYGGTNKLWVGEGYLGADADIRDIMDDLIEGGQIRPFIVVMPNAFNSYMGSFYLNSATTGNWEDFVVRDLVEYVDSNYRTIPASVSRGISGHSMGGYGSMMLAMKYPHVFGSVYGMSGPGAFILEGWDPSDTFFIAVNPETGEQSPLPMGLPWQLALPAENWEAVPAGLAQIAVAWAAALSPNPDSVPFFADFPFELVDGELVPDTSVQDLWEKSFLVGLVDDYATGISRLRAMHFDWGSEDAFAIIPPTCRALSDALTAAGIAHVAEEFVGSHASHTVERLGTKVLPLFSEVLESDTRPMTAARTATVVATVTDGGTPVAGVEIALARSVSGRTVHYLWRGVTNASGTVEIEVTAHAPQFWRTGATGHYLAKATDPVSGEAIGSWSSVPINGGKENVVSLPIGERADVATGDALVMALAPASPNPFNPTTQILYQIAEPGDVRLTIYNLLGQQVRTLVQSYQPAGRHRAIWHGKDDLGRAVSSGVYIYRIRSGDLTATRKMILLK